MVAGEGLRSQVRGQLNERAFLTRLGKAAADAFTIMRLARCSSEHGRVGLH